MCLLSFERGAAAGRRVLSIVAFAAVSTEAAIRLLICDGQLLLRSLGLLKVVQDAFAAVMSTCGLMWSRLAAVSRSAAPVYTSAVKVTCCVAVGQKLRHVFNVIRKTPFGPDSRRHSGRP